MPSGENGALKVVISLVGALSVTVAASGSITSVMGMGKEFISGIDTFSKALIPSVAAAEAAHRCGFSDYTAFYRAFKAEYSISPTAVRKQINI